MRKPLPQRLRWQTIYRTERMPQYLRLDGGSSIHRMMCRLQTLARSPINHVCIPKSVNSIQLNMRRWSRRLAAIQSNTMKRDLNSNSSSSRSYKTAVATLPSMQPTIIIFCSARIKIGMNVVTHRQPQSIRRSYERLVHRQRTPP